MARHDKDHPEAAVVAGEIVRADMSDGLSQALRNIVVTGVLGANVRLEMLGPPVAPSAASPVSYTGRIVHDTSCRRAS